MRAAAVLELRRRKGLEDLYFFDREILGYQQMAESPHRLMCDGCQHGSRKQLDLWPRGHFKSSCITIGYAIQRIVQNPDIRILIGNVVLDTAKNFLREIKGQFEKNEEFRMLYGDFVNKDDKWTETEIIVKSRTKTHKEPTITVAGVGKSLTGNHYDLILGDDIVNRDTVNTLEQIEKTRQWWADAMSLLEPNGEVRLIGTRYHYADLYGYLITNMSREYDVHVHSAFDDKGEPIFPARFTKEKLDELKREQGSYMFSCQYLNNPVDDENAKFKKSWFKYETPEALENKQVWTTMTVDRAYSLNKSADYTSFVIRKVDMDNFWHIQKPIRIRATEGEIVKKIFDLREYYAVDKVGVEQLAFAATIKPVLDEEMRRRNTYFEVVELKGRSSKIARIEGLVPRFETGSVIFTGQQSEFIELEDELLRFPVAEHDDLADALAYHNDEEMAGVPSGNINQQVHQILAARQNEEF